MGMSATSPLRVTSSYQASFERSPVRSARPMSGSVTVSATSWLPAMERLSFGWLDQLGHRRVLVCSFGGACRRAPVLAQVDRRYVDAREYAASVIHALSSEKSSHSCHGCPR